MSNTNGKNLRLSLFGESHGEYIGATLDGIAPGIKIDYEFLEECLNKRRPDENLDTKRREKDEYKFISGVFNGYTTGEALTIIIKNSDVISQDYSLFKDKPRPSHTDYVKRIKEEGFNDYRGGGASSARLTAPIVAISSIIIKTLENKGIYIENHIKSIGSVEDRSFNEKNLDDDFKSLKNKDFPVLNDIKDEMINEINSYKNDSDSIGGVIETCIKGLTVGVGEPWFDSLEGKIANAMFSIPGIKGIEFGLGFGFKNIPGSIANDEFFYDNGVVKTRTNNNGGINGGISNGMPIIFRVVIRPTSSIGKVQNTINLSTKENDILEIKGRHDASIVRRSSIIIKSMTALTIADLLMEYNAKKTLN